LDKGTGKTERDFAWTSAVAVIFAKLLALKKRAPIRRADTSLGRTHRTIRGAFEQRIFPVCLQFWSHFPALFGRQPIEMVKRLAGTMTAKTGTPCFAIRDHVPGQSGVISFTRMEILCDDEVHQP
jgi:hypothetical protein